MSILSIASLAGVLFFMAVSAMAQGQYAQQSQADRLPEGARKAVVEAVCTGCHTTDQITRSSGYSREGWQELILNMIDVSASPDFGTLCEYLATHFPAKTQRQPTLVSGDASITFREWKVPTLGQRSRDPIQAADGSIWWAGQWGNLIGRIDPKTGDMREYPLPEGAKPHSVTIDQEGNIWYTGNGNGTLGKFDPRTEEITVYPMPDPAARDPHTAISVVPTGQRPVSG